MPKTRSTITAMTAAANAPTAITPPRKTRCQVTCGLTLSAMFVTVPCATALPPGVSAGVRDATRRVV